MSQLVGVVSAMSDHSDDDSDVESSTSSFGSTPPKPQSSAPTPLPWFHLCSNLLFVVGSVLYLEMAVRDLRWSRTLHTLPLHVRTADDDYVWTNYGRQHQQTVPTTAQYNTHSSDVADDPSVHYDSYWADLPSDVQANYGVLGYDASVWDNGVKVPAESLAWDELTTAQQQAADALGYTGEAWPHASSEQEQASSVDRYWVDLPPELRAAAIVLGYDESIWDNAGEPSSADFWWRELTSAQQEAARTLGYDRYSWDGVARPSTSVVASSVSQGTPSTDTNDDNENTDDGNSYAYLEDDYVWQLGNSEHWWISEYMILYFSTASCFVLVGVLELLREKKAFHLLLIFAGLNGVASAIHLENDVQLSNVFNAISVHFYLLEAATLLWGHVRHGCGASKISWRSWTFLMAVANGLFVIGSSLDVLLSYFYLFDDTSDWDYSLIGVSIFAASCWLLCSLVHLLGTLYCVYDSRKKYQALQQK